MPKKCILTYLPPPKNLEPYTSALVSKKGRSNLL